MLVESGSVRERNDDRVPTECMSCDRFTVAIYWNSTFIHAKPLQISLQKHRSFMWF